MRGGNDRLAVQQSQSFRVCGTCIDGRCNVSDRTGQNDDALAAHTTRDAQIVQLDVCRLDGDIRRFNRRCRRERFNKPKRAFLFRLLRAVNSFYHP